MGEYGQDPKWEEQAVYSICSMVVESKWIQRLRMICLLNGTACCEDHHERTVGAEKSDFKVTVGQDKRGD